MRWLVFIALSILVSSFKREERAVLRHHFIVLPASQLVINGKTNVNKFKCAIARYSGTDTLVLQEGGVKGKPIFVKGYVGLQASSFDCGMAAMTKDFTKTIKAKQFPQIGIDFKSFERLPNYGNSADKFNGTLAISIAGISRPFDMECTVEPNSNGIVNLKGGRNFQFSDFDLNAPTKMLGAIRVDDTLEVQFHLVLKLDANN
ncbi:MAG TPA: hypothetical protein PLR06_07670 [Cyclobacteriaceae bacterium]|nr:hypothetical protein [Cyclobacteriaceae bacterium]